MEELSKEKELPSSRDKKAAKAENVRGEREQREKPSHRITPDPGAWKLEKPLLQEKESQN